MALAKGDFQQGFILGGLIGDAIGGVFGMVLAYRIYRKMQRTNDEVISQIREMADGE